MIVDFILVKMVKYCSAMFCSNSSATGHSTHVFPKDPAIRRQWVKFVLTKRANFVDPSPTSQACLCCEHFTADNFHSPLMSAMGIKANRILKHDAVPSVHATPPATPKEGQQSKQKGRKRQNGKQLAPVPTAVPLPVKKRRAASKLEVARLLTISHSMEATGEQEQACACPSEEEEDVPFQPDKSMCTIVTESKGTQCSDLPRRRSIRVGTNRVNMVDATTQYDRDICIAETASTPVKASTKVACEFSSHLSPIRPSPPSSPASSPNKSLYKPSEESFMEANEEDESDEDGDIMTDASSSASEANPANVPLSYVEGVGKFHSERKFMVFESQLLDLFRSCPLCTEPCTRRISKVVGTAAHVAQRCDSCPFSRSWKSQPYLRQMPVGNLLLSAGILMSGSLPTQIIRVFKHINLACISNSTFHRHQSGYVIPVIIGQWKEHQTSLFQTLHSMEGGLDLAGDGRSDSPGHSAKYGGYNLMEQRLNKVLDVQLVQSNEVGSSNACELEGLKRSMAVVLDEDFTISSLVTDRHLSIGAYVRDTLKPNNPAAADLKHYNDVWHTAKSLGKKIDKIANKMDCREAGKWKRAVINHMYYVAAAAQEGPDRENVIEAMWESIDNHIHDEHEHSSALYPMCDHPHLIGMDRDREWLIPGSDVSGFMSALLLSKSLIRDVRKLTPKYQTSSLEAFHSLLIRFAPKHTHFMWLCMLARYYLAAMHYNENSARLQAVTVDGRPQYSIRYPKFKKGEHTVRVEKTKATHLYVTEMMCKLLIAYAQCPRSLKESINDIRNKQPPTLAAGLDHPDKSDAIKSHLSRFNP